VCLVLVTDAIALAQQCAGDCNGDASVTIDELIVASTIAIGDRAVDDCMGADRNGDGQVTIDELIAAVGSALDGCPSTPTASPTVTPSASATPSDTVTPTATVTPTSTFTPTDTPTPRPTDTATSTPTETPTLRPTDTPTPSPTDTPTASPSDTPATPTGTPTPSTTGTPTLTATDTPTAAPTPTLAPGMVTLQAHNDWAVDAAVEFSGERLSGPPPGMGAVVYGPLSMSISSSDATLTEIKIPAGLAPGVWVHHARVRGAAEYVQHQQTLVIGDPMAPNLVEWRLFRAVLTVNRGDDDGDGVCDETCTLRDAIDGTTMVPPPVLIRFAAETLADNDGRVRIRIDHNAPLLVRAPGTVIDGRDAAGNPSPLADFADRIYPTVIALIATNANPDPTQACPCQESNGGTIRVQADHVHLEGLAIVRELAAEGTICCGDQDLIAFDAGSYSSGVSTCLLDGGARAISSAQVAQGQAHSPTGKDCVEARNTGATADTAVTVDTSELRYCHDRGVKSKLGYVRLERNWIHHNLRGGLFALSPTGPTTGKGVIEAIGNLIERNGRNCPTGDPSDCGPAQRITRTQASEMSAQGNLTSLITAGNVLRGGVLEGMYFQGRSEGTIADDYICGVDNSAGGGIGVLVKLITPAPPAPCLSEDDCENDGICLQGQCVDDTAGAPSVSVHGVTTAYNGDSGVRLNGYRTADFGTGGTDGAGHNAFTDNGFTLNGTSRLKRNFVNALVDSTAVVSAEGNQWQHCYPSSGAVPDSCSMTSIANDTNNTSAAAEPDRVDTADPQPHASTAAVEINSVAPLRVVEGGIVHINGRGFDAVSGHAGRRDCAALKEGNGCDPLRGTCVEFLTNGRWTAAADVLAVTPTHLVVRSPMTCTTPTVLRVRRRVLSGGDVTSEPVPFCRN
jgi:hypothetical protein